MIVELDSLERQLRAHEGMRLLPYDDATGKKIIRGSLVSGCATIGIGHNLTDRGLTKDQCISIFHEDVELVVAQLTSSYGWFRHLDWTRQAVLIDMCFNLGFTKFSKFSATLAAVQRQDYRAAAVHMLASKWSEQVGRRALTLAHMMETGINPFDHEDDGA